MDDIKKPLLKATKKDIKNLINDHTFLVENQNKGEPVTPCMYVYKYKNQSDGSLNKLKPRIVVRGDPQNKELVVDIWSPTASMRNLRFVLAGASKHKAIVHQLYFIGALLQETNKNIVFVNLDSRYTDYFP